MAFRNISVLLTANTTSLRSGLTQAAREVDRFSNKVESHQRGITSSGKLMAAAVGAGALIVATGLGAAVVGAAKFEQQMRNVNSISYLSESQFQALGKSVLDLSKSVPQSANDLAAGLYDIASSGFQGAEGLTVLQASAVAASAGMSTTANAAKAIAATLNAYGRGAQDATDVSDALFQTVNLGVISFDELTGVIGDVVGTAAAAKVPIEDVGAAIAAMTLTGLSGAESGTSLNRVLQSLIQPSDSLKTLFGQLGYESGSAALKSKGLSGVMDDLRKATGGNIDALLALFPEIRSARGALALMANEGKNYAKTQAAVGDATNRAGATQKAFREQMKATSAQFRILVNRIQAGAISLGTKLLPTVRDVLEGIGRLGHDAATLSGSFSILAPLVRNLAELGGNLAEILEAIYTAAAPVGKVLLGLVAVGLISSLNALAATLAAVTGFIKDNGYAAAALATILTAALLPALYKTVAALAVQVYEAAVLAFFRLQYAVSGAATAMGAMSGASIVASAGLAAIAVTIGAAVYSWQKAGQAADAYVASTTKGFNALDPDKAQGTIDALRQTAAASLELQGKYEGAVGTLRAGWDAITGNTDDVARTGKAAAEEANRLAQNVANASENIDILSRSTGLSAAALRELAISNNVDLSKPYNQSSEEIDRMRGLVKGLEAQTGISADKMDAALGADVERLQQMAEEMQAVADAAQKAFLESNDVISKFKPTTAEEQTKKVTEATERLEQANRSLNELEARQAGKKKRSISDEQDLARARDKVAEATEGVRQAQGGVQSTGSQLQQFYKDQIRSSTEFVNQINEAAKRGVDPQLIARLLEAGPEAAAPILEGLLSDHSGRMIAMANTSEKKLREISEKTATFARLTHLAVTSETDGMVKDLGTAMAIAAQNMAQGATATAESIGKAIGKPTAEVLRIAKEYGITIVSEAQGAINTKGLKLPTPVYPAGYVGPLPPGAVRAGTSTAQDEQRDRLGRAGGGRIDGPGTSTSDSIPIMASNGEFVIRAVAARQIGYDKLESMNRWGRYAGGGVIGESRRQVVGAAPSTITNNHRSVTNRYEFSGPIQGVKMEDAVEFADRRVRASNLIGGM